MMLEQFQYQEGNGLKDLKLGSVVDSGSGAFLNFRS